MRNQLLAKILTPLVFFSLAILAPALFSQGVTAVGGKNTPPGQEGKNQMMPQLAAPSYPDKAIVSESETFRLARFPYSFDFPWALAFLPDGRLLISQRQGSLLLIEGEKSRAVAGIPRVVSGGQGGLLDIALHPNFKENKRLYLSFSAPGTGGSSTALFSALFDESQGSGPRLIEGKTIWESAKKSASTIHYGSRIAFDAAGFLFLTTGERGEGSRARDLSDAQGKLIRLRDDGSVPPDNPFVARAGALPQIWSYGHRNPQGLAFNPADGLVWLSEHGPKGGDEINIAQRGADFGWDLTSYGLAYSGAKVGIGPSAAGVSEPLLYWTPSIAPSGLAFYTGDVFPRWKGNLFSGALAGQELRRIRLEGKKVISQEVLLKGVVGRIRDVRMGPDGFLYLLTDGKPGFLYRLEG